MPAPERRQEITETIAEVSTLFSVLESISETSSRTDKEMHLAKLDGNGVATELLRFCYNPYVQFFIKKVPKYVSTYPKRGYAENYFAFRVLLLDLKERYYTGNAATKRVAEVFGALSEEEHKWYAKVLQKDLKIGITATTINKVLPSLEIPAFKCSLAHPFDEKKLPATYYQDPKLDGYRCLLEIDTQGVVKMYTRSGKLLEGYDDIAEDASNYLDKGYVYDSEIMSVDFAGTQASAFRKTTGKQGVLHIFDVIPLSEFVNNKGVLTYEQRVELRNSILPDNVATLVNVKNSGLQTKSSESMDYIMAVNAELLEQGYEGSMIKDAKATYQFKRSWAVQKVKKWDTLDLPIVRIEPGEEGTRLANTLGKVYVEYKGNEVGVGSGFSDEERAEIWANQAGYINRTVEVQYFEESKSTKTGLVSLRFPTFIRMRPDKD